MILDTFHLQIVNMYNSTESFNVLADFGYTDITFRCKEVSI